jgi:TonB family protein
MTARASVVAGFVPFVLLAAAVFPVSAQTPPAAPVYMPGPGFTNPVLLKEVKPNYTPEAMRSRLQGTVLLRVIVRENGTVDDIRVTRSLDPGLDAEAVRAAERWLFRPGEKDGEPVAMYVTLELAFRLHSKFGEGAYLESTPGLVLPARFSHPNPSYTPGAMAARLQGYVVVEVVVDETGRVTDTRVAQSLDTQFGLDEAALKTAGEARFQPATLNGKPVKAIVSLAIPFRLH